MNLVFVDLFSVFFRFYNLDGLFYMKVAHWIRFGDENNEVNTSRLNSLVFKTKEVIMLIKTTVVKTKKIVAE